MNGYQDNSSRKNACRSGMPLMSVSYTHLTLPTIA